MNKLAAGIVALGSIVASSLLGGIAAPTAEAAVTSYSWSSSVVYVYDTTAKLTKSDGTPVWPVRAAAKRWSDGNPIDFRYTTTGCPAKSQCVTVKQAELASPTVGVTATASVGADIRASTITLDKTYGRTNSAAKRRNVVCHELGHSLGLQHRTAKSSCLTSYASTQKLPDATDIKKLNTMYRGK